MTRHVGILEDPDDSDDSVVEVPFVKPPPVLIVLGESDEEGTESGTSKNRKSKDPQETPSKSKKRGSRKNKSGGDKDNDNAVASTSTATLSSKNKGGGGGRKSGNEALLSPPGATKGSMSSHEKTKRDKTNRNVERGQEPGNFVITCGTSAGSDDAISESINSVVNAVDAPVTDFLLAFGTSPVPPATPIGSTKSGKARKKRQAEETTKKKSRQNFEQFLKQINLPVPQINSRRKSSGGTKNVYASSLPETSTPDPDQCANIASTSAKTKEPEIVSSQLPESIGLGVVNVVLETDKRKKSSKKKSTSQHDEEQPGFTATELESTPTDIRTNIIVDTGNNSNKSEGRKRKDRDDSIPSSSGGQENQSPTKKNRHKRARRDNVEPNIQFGSDFDKANVFFEPLNKLNPNNVFGTDGSSGVGDMIPNPQSFLPEHFTAEMRDYYSTIRSSQLNFSLVDVASKQSDDPRLWKMPEDWKHMAMMQRKGKDKESVMFCRFCNKRGDHIIRDCPKRINGPICQICGEKGHTIHNCRKSHCLECLNPIPHPGLFPKGCRYCILNKKQKPCLNCHILGHDAGSCPDNWRRYHSTTINVDQALQEMLKLKHETETERTNLEGLDINVDKSQHEFHKQKLRQKFAAYKEKLEEFRKQIQPPVIPRPKINTYCANCGNRGHSYFNCKARRPQGYDKIHPFKPYVVREFVLTLTKEQTRIFSEITEFAAKLENELDPSTSSPDVEIISDNEDYLNEQEPTAPEEPPPKNTYSDEQAFTVPAELPTTGSTAGASVTTDFHTDEMIANFDVDLRVTPGNPIIQPPFLGAPSAPVQQMPIPSPDMFRPVPILFYVPLSVSNDELQRIAANANQLISSTAGNQLVNLPAQVPSISSTEEEDPIETGPKTSLGAKEQVRGTPNNKSPIATATPTPKSKKSPGYQLSSRRWEEISEERENLVQQLKTRLGVNVTMDKKAVKITGGTAAYRRLAKENIEKYLESILKGRKFVPNFMDISERESPEIVVIDDEDEPRSKSSASGHESKDRSESDSRHERGRPSFHNSHRSRSSENRNELDRREHSDRFRGFVDSYRSREYPRRDYQYRPYYPSYPQDRNPYRYDRRSFQSRPYPNPRFEGPNGFPNNRSRNQRYFHTQ